jgi:hypothetical protein
MGLALAPGVLPDARAFTATLTNGAPTIIYLQVGVGAFTPANSNYTGANGHPAGTPTGNTTINQVAVTLASGTVGNKTAQAMASNSGATASFYDSYAFCNANTLYIGGFYRTAGAGTTKTATVTATVPASLTDAAGDTIPFSQISWTSAGNGDTNGNGLPEVFPGGAFTGGGTQSVGLFTQNQWAESCWSFSYANTVTPAGGTYTGRVTYTVTLP